MSRHRRAETDDAELTDAADTSEIVGVLPRPSEGADRGGSAPAADPTRRKGDLPDLPDGTRPMRDAGVDEALTDFASLPMRWPVSDNLIATAGPLAPALRRFLDTLSPFVWLLLDEDSDDDLDRARKLLLAVGVLMTVRAGGPRFDRDEDPTVRAWLAQVQDVWAGSAVSSALGGGLFSRGRTVGQTFHDLLGDECITNIHARVATVQRQVPTIPLTTTYARAARELLAEQASFLRRVPEPTDLQDIRSALEDLAHGGVPERWDDENNEDYVPWTALLGGDLQTMSPASRVAAAAAAAVAFGFGPFEGRDLEQWQWIEDHVLLPLAGDPEWNGFYPGRTLSLDRLERVLDDFRHRRMAMVPEDAKINDLRDLDALILADQSAMLGTLFRRGWPRAATLQRVQDMWDHFEGAYRTATARLDADRRRRAEAPALAELDAMVGLHDVKTMVRRLRSRAALERDRAAAGIATDRGGRHVVFAGNPGTGKTTVARILADIYFELGLLSRGHLVEVTRADLVADYAGQTAGRTRRVVRDALGGLLFIDEAYALAPTDSGGGTDDTFGREAIDTLVQAMENHRDDLVVVVAGYGPDMRRFVQANPGLRSRFTEHVDFPDYSTDELVEIVRREAGARGFTVTEEAAGAVRTGLAQLPRGQGFGNGRLARTVVEDAVLRQGDRLSAQDEQTPRSLDVLDAVDFDDLRRGGARALPDRSEQDLADALAELDDVIGLDGVKEQVRQFAAVLRTQRLRARHGLADTPVGRHLVFVGPPGTGKTTIARVVARVYAALGLVRDGQLIETDRADLVAGWVGQTAIRTRDVVERARGGVLFVDEAYALVSQRDSRFDFGAEAVDTLLKSMEDLRDELAVIVAGYPAEMERFLDSNPGLRSRFDRTVVFEPYGDDDLVRILAGMARTQGYRLAPGVEPLLRDRFTARRHLPGFANGRTARTLLQELVAQQSVRITTIPDPSLDDLSVIHREDVVP